MNNRNNKQREIDISNGGGTLVIGGLMPSLIATIFLYLAMGKTMERVIKSLLLNEKGIAIQY